MTAVPREVARLARRRAAPPDRVHPSWRANYELWRLNTGEWAMRVAWAPLLLS
jgi:hypothetical protein